MVVIDGDDIHGDGVNVASRLEGLAGSVAEINAQPEHDAAFLGNVGLVRPGPGKPGALARGF